MMRSKLSLSILMVLALALGVGSVACAGSDADIAWANGALVGALLRVESDGSRVYHVTLQVDDSGAGVIAQDFACALLLAEPGMSIRLISDTEFEMTVQPGSEPPKRITPIAPDTLGLRVRINARGAYLEGDVERALSLIGTRGVYESIADDAVPLGSGMEEEDGEASEQPASESKAKGNGLVSDPWGAPQLGIRPESQSNEQPAESAETEPATQLSQPEENMPEPEAAQEQVGSQEREIGEELELIEELELTEELALTEEQAGSQEQEIVEEPEPVEEQAADQVREDAQEPEAYTDLEVEQEPAAEVPLVERKITVVREIADIIRDGDEFCIKANLVGYDGMDYELQWQYDNGKGWRDLPGANRPELRLIANSENVNYDWRILVNCAEPEEQ